MRCSVCERMRYNGGCMLRLSTACPLSLHLSGRPGLPAWHRRRPAWAWAAGRSDARHPPFRLIARRPPAPLLHCRLPPASRLLPPLPFRLAAGLRRRPPGLRAFTGAPASPGLPPGTGRLTTGPPTRARRFQPVPAPAGAARRRRLAAGGRPARRPAGRSLFRARPPGPGRAQAACTAARLPFRRSQDAAFAASGPFRFRAWPRRAFQPGARLPALPDCAAPCAAAGRPIAGPPCSTPAFRSAAFIGLRLLPALPLPIVYCSASDCQIIIALCQRL